MFDVGVTAEVGSVDVGNRSVSVGSILLVIGKQVSPMSLSQGVGVGR